MPIFVQPNSSECVTLLLLSPRYASVSPFSRPFFSWIVIRSARIWHGCEKLVSALMTGTVANLAISSIFACSNSRAMIMSTYRLTVFTVSSMLSLPAPSGEVLVS